MSKAKFSVGQKVKYTYRGKEFSLTVMRVIPTYKGFFYECCGWEKTSWGEIAESELND